MKKLLTVAVPTYNRHDDLKILAESFLRPAAIIDDVEVLVCDNSDATVAERNRLLFQDTRIRYIHNGQNLGYDGNLIRCLENAKGEWIWFIPDSDEMYLDAFRDFVFFLREGGSQEYRAILIPSNSVSDRSRVQVGLEPEAIFTCDHEDDWEKSRTPREMLSRTGRLPFVSFSSVAIRLDNDSRAKARDIYKRFAGNVFIQIPLYLTLINPDGFIRYWDKPLLKVTWHKHIRFSLADLLDDLDEVLEWLETSVEVNRETLFRMRKSYRSAWAIWYARHKGGVFHIKDADSAICKLAKSLLDTKQYKLFLFLLVSWLLPEAMVRRLLIWKDL